MARIEDHNIHEILLRGEDILVALESLRKGRDLGFYGLLVAEINGDQGVLLVAGSGDGCSKIDLPRLKDQIFSLEKTHCSRLAVLEVLKAAFQS
ncbi:MAG: hypothetical protein HOI66_09715 [Verrucomicrobia bacterium]|nr:hypothetical protein [Verrucomicrobiota bacterium]